MKKRLLYIDDEVHNLISFKANYRKHYEIYTAESAEEGKKILREKNIHVVITDQRMPHITGVQFLESIIDEYPNSTRILLSGYADLQVVIEAINKGHIYRYVMKPFDTDEFKKIIDDAFALYSLRENGNELLNKYKKIFEESGDAMFILDEESYIKDMNLAGLNLFKLSKNEIINIALRDFYAIEEERIKFKEEILRKGIVINYPLRLKSSKNNLIDCLISANTIIDENHAVIGFQGIIKDVTKQKETESLVMRTIIDTQENERIRFAKDIHDSLGQQLSAVKFYIATLLDSNQNSKSKTLLLKSNDTLDTALKELRSICFNLMPRTIETSGLIETINELCRKTELKDLLEFEIDVAPNFPALNKSLEIAIFRVVQEFINNSITHGKATIINILLKHEPEKIQIELKDNGSGFDVDKISSPAGIGLQNIRSRIQLYQGDVKINTAPDKGVKFSIFIPLSKQWLNAVPTYS